MKRNIIAILRGIRPEEAVAAGEALVVAGLTRIEVPLNSPEPFASIAALAQRFAGKAVEIGAGTVLHVDEVAKVAQAGGTLIVSPNMDVKVIAETTRRGMVAWPGVFTATEAFAALRAGASGLKLFPAVQAGPEGLQALRSVLPTGTQIYAVGGAGPKNFTQWLSAGADGLGIGSALYKPGMSTAEIATNALRIVSAYDDAAQEMRA